MTNKNNSSGSFGIITLLVSLAGYYWGKSQGYYWLWKLSQIVIIIELVIIIILIGLGLALLYNWIRWRKL